MSTRFTKILTYCVLAMAIVAIVVCAAICLTNAVGVKISVDALYLSKTYATENGQEVVIKINGEQTNELVVKKDSTVTLSFEAPGYNFNGWYGVSGSEVTGDTETIGTSVSYEFKASSDMNFAAQFEAIVYNLTYIGSDESEAEVDEAYKQLTYGSALPSLSNNANDGIFLGWKLADGAIVNTVNEFSDENLETEGVNVTLTEARRGISEYNIQFNISGIVSGTAGYDASTGVNVSSLTRDYYSVTSVVINSNTFSISDTTSINAELVENYLTAQTDPEQVNIEATVVWQLNFNEISFTDTQGGPFGSDSEVIAQEDPRAIEDIRIVDLFVKESANGFTIKYGETSKAWGEADDFRNVTVKNILQWFGIETTQTGYLDFEITWS